MSEVVKFVTGIRHFNRWFVISYNAIAKVYNAIAKVTSRRSRDELVAGAGMN